MPVTAIRRFDLTRVELGVHALNGSWFVYDRDIDAPKVTWRLHCGPYSSFDQARDWIHDIHETDLRDD